MTEITVYCGLFNLKL